MQLGVSPPRAYQTRTSAEPRELFSITPVSGMSCKSESFWERLGTLNLPLTAATRIA
jgi:hypothetical protein